MELGAVDALLAAIEASQGPDIAVQLDDLGGAGEVVQAIDVLSDQGELRAQQFKAAEGVVTEVGLGESDGAAALFVLGPDQLWIPGKGFGGCEILEAKVAPVAAVAAKGRDAAFGGYSGAGEHGDAAGEAE